MASDYLAIVERFYLVLRRQGLTLSAHDIRLVEKWEQAGIPVNVVCKALLDGTEKFRAVRGDERLPMTLHYFADQVEEAAQARQTPTIKTDATPEKTETFLSEDLAELAWIGQKETCPRRRDAYRAAWRSLRSGSENTRTEALIAADTVAVNCLWNSLTAAEQTLVSESVDRLIQPELKNLGTRGETLRRRALFEDEICRQFDLVRISDNLANSKQSLD